MDKGLLFAVGVMVGSLSTTLLYQLLMLTDEDARRYFSGLFRRTGADRPAINPEAREAVNSKEYVLQTLSNDTTEEQPGGVGNRPAGQFLCEVDHYDCDCMSCRPWTY